VRRDCCVGGSTIIRTICRHLGNSTLNLIQQRGHLGWIVSVLIREGLRHDHAAVGINHLMEFAPLPARLRAVFRLQPLTRPVDLQAGAVDYRPVTNFGWVFLCGAWMLSRLAAGHNRFNIP
jgi:hypothetical protein